jgi:hypothetical protein
VSLKNLNTHNFGISRLPLGSLGKKTSLKGPKYIIRKKVVSSFQM